MPTTDAISDKQDLLRAFDYCLSFFKMWNKEGRLADERLGKIVAYYEDERKRLDSGHTPAEPMRLPPANVCWSCKRADTARAGYCVDCGAPVQTAEVQRLLYLVFLCHEVKKHEQAGRLGFETTHDLMREANERVGAMRRQLDGKRIPMAELATEPAEPRRASTPLAEEVHDEPRRRPERDEPRTARREERPRRRRPIEPPLPPPAPRRSLIEIILDPHSIQWLLASGGVLLVVGLIIWLWTTDIFKDPLVLAILMGGATLSVLAGGWALVSATRFQMAGRALTLLACLLLPFNLWFWDYKGLVPLLEPGYHLWIGALICCVLYAISARLLKDVVFVYVLVGGVTLTGLLLLADKNIDRFFEITGPCTLLVAIGLVCIHAERAFADGDGPFSRKRFGLAFFWSGQIVLAAGLLLLLGAQVYGCMLLSMQPANSTGAVEWIPEVAYVVHVKYLAIILTLVGTYAYFYSDFVVRRIGVYLYLAVFTLLWAEVQVITLFNLERPVELVIITLSLTSLLANLAIAAGRQTNSTLARAGLPLGVFLAAVPVLFGLFLHFRATVPVGQALHYHLDWIYVAAMAVTALTCRIGAYLYRQTYPAVSMAYFFATAAATMAAAGGLLLKQNARISWENQAQLLMIIPIIYIIAARLYRGHTPETPLVWCAHAATAVMLVASMSSAFRGTLLVEADPLNLQLAGFFAEAALFYLLAGVFRNRSFNIYLCTAMASAAVWQLLKYFSVADEYYTLVFAAVGLAFLVGYRFAPLEGYKGRLPEAAFQCGHTLLLLAFTAVSLLSLSRLLTESADLNHHLLVTLLLQTGISLLAVFLVRHRGWRQVYVVTTVMLAGLTVLVLTWFVDLTLPQKLEIVCVSVGLLLVGVGHLGWFREQERQSDIVTLALVVGCLLVGVPLFGFVFAGRLNPTFDTFHTLNEIGMLVVALLLLATGAMCRLRTTTLTGGVMLVLYLLTLVLYLRLPERLQSTAMYLMIGGGTFFAVGLLLSLYRESLLKLPEKIKRREGLFKVLSWR